MSTWISPRDFLRNNIILQQVKNKCQLKWRLKKLQEDYSLNPCIIYGNNSFPLIMKVVVQFSSIAQPCLTFCNPTNHSTPGLPVHHQLLEFTQTHVHWVSDAIQPSHPLLSLLLLPPIPLSIRVFSSESTLCMRWAKYWSFSLSIIPSKEIPGLIFRRDWLDLLAVQGTLKSLLQHHSSKAWLQTLEPREAGHPEGKWVNRPKLPTKKTGFQV